MAWTSDDVNGRGLGSAARSRSPNALAAVDDALRRHQHRPDSLIEVLHAAQREIGHLDPPLLNYIARRLRVPPSRVFGVASFYHAFTFIPDGEHSCVVCLGTACYVKGSSRLAERVTALTGLSPGETDPEGRLSFRVARCLGVCGLAPLAVLDGSVRGMLAEESLTTTLKGWLERGPDGSPAAFGD